MTITSGARRDEPSAAWFDGLARGVLLIRRCGVCGQYGRPDATSCDRCWSQDLSWVEAAGTGTIVCTIRDHAGPAPVDLAPVDLALVELDEGPWLHSRLVDVPDPVPGARVSLVVLPPADPEDEPVPGFGPLRAIV